MTYHRLTKDRTQLIVTLKSAKRSGHIFLRGGRGRFLRRRVARKPRVPDELRAGPVEVSRFANLPLSLAGLEESRRVRVGGIDGRQRRDARVERVDVRG